MAGVNSTIRVTDGMSKALLSMNRALTMVINQFENMQELSSNSVDVASIEDAREELNKAANAVIELGNGLDEAGDNLERCTEKSGKLDGALGKVVATAAGLFAIRKAVGFIEECTEAFNTQLNAANQLRGVLANTVGREYENAYNVIKSKASDIQKEGIFGDEAMLAGAAELATYFKDTSAMEKMMDTLSNYAIGMSGGAPVDSRAMVEYATGLGKIMAGSYEAMTKKGFEFTDIQKAIIEGTASEEQIVAELGEQYIGVSQDMQAAAAITNVIDESWANLYQTMSNTPQGKVQQLSNTWGDIKEMIAAKLYPVVVKLLAHLEDKMPKIEEYAVGLADGLSKIMDFLFPVGEFIMDNFDHIIALVAGVTGAVVAWKIAQLALNTAMWANPILLIIGLIGLLIAGIIELCAWYKENEITWDIMCHNMLTSFDVTVVKILSCVQKLIDGVTEAVNHMILLQGSAEKLNSIDIVSKYKNGAKERFNTRVDAINDKIAEKERLEAEAEAAKSDPLAQYYADISANGFSDVNDTLDDISGSTAGIEKALDVTEEDLKYLRDLAEQEAVNRFTTAEIKVEMTNNNNISSDTDLDGMVDALGEKLLETMEIAAEGV